MLVRLEDEQARRKGQLWRFQLTSDPLDFVAKVAKIPASCKKGHVVIAPAVDTDFSLSATIAAAFMGCFCTSPRDFLKEGAEPPPGISYNEKCRTAKQSFHVAVSAALAEDFPTLPQLFRAIAQAPRSSFKFHMSEKKLCKFFKKSVKTTPSIQHKIFVLSKNADMQAADKKVKAIYVTPRRFLLKCAASERGVCPGWKKRD